MSEQTGAVAGAEATGKQGDPVDAPLGEGGKKALEAERTARATAEKAAAELQAKLDEIEKANLSEVERAKREAEEARAELVKAKGEALRARIQAKHGISDEDADLFLTGSDQATLAKQAERLASKAEDRKKNGNYVSREGRTQATGSNTDDERQFVRNLFGSE